MGIAFTQGTTGATATRYLIEGTQMTGPRTVICVLDKVPYAVESSSWQRIFGGQGDAFSIYSGSNGLFLKNTPETNAARRPSVARESLWDSTRKQIIRAYFGEGEDELWIDGVLVARSTNLQDSGVRGLDTQPSYLGWAPPTTSQAGSFTGEFLELIIVPGRAPLAIESTLAAKHGITLLQDAARQINHTAHRGVSDLAPENTLPAYDPVRFPALTHPYMHNGWVECDIQKTSDGHWVLLHDSSVDRTSDGSGSISSMTLAQAKALDFGSWKGAEFAGTRISTWAEFSEHCNTHGLKVWVEFKISPTIAEAEDILDAWTGAGNSLDHIVPQSFTYADLVKVRGVAGPTVRLAYLRSQTVGSAGLPEYEADTGAKILFLNIDNNGSPAQISDVVSRFGPDVQMAFYTPTGADIGGFKLAALTHPNIVGLTSNKWA